MTRKATNDGTCQWCGRRQRLPGGLLAEHGYEIRNGWRMGRCPGSSHQPYEVSCDLIQQSIEWARDEVVKHNEQAGALEVQRLDPSNVIGWHHTYHRELSSRTKGAVYLWEYGTFGTVNGRLVHDTGSTVADYKPHDCGSYQQPHVAAHEGRQRYAKALRRRANEEREYADRQAERIRDWKPQPLLDRAR